MPGDDALHGGEADTGAFEFAGRVQPLEDAKELTGEGGTEETRIGVDADAIRDDEVGLAVWSGVAQRAQDFLHELREIERLANQLATSGARKLQEILDELRHPVPGLQSVGPRARI